MSRLIPLLIPLLLLTGSAAALVPSLAGQGHPDEAASGHHAGPLAAMEAIEAPWFSPEVSVRPQTFDSPAERNDAAVGAYQLTFHCPPVTGSDLDDTRCPAYILDTEDIMSQPVLLVDPTDPSLIAFNALHGGPGARTPAHPPLPDPASRDNAIHQPHTTFQTTSAGETWQDNRYYSRLQGPADIYGEDNAATLDHRGNLYLNSLYSYREESGGPLEHAIIFWKSQRINRPVEYDSNYVVWETRSPGASIEKVHMEHVRATDQVFSLWHEVGDGQWIDVAYADASGGSVWTAINASDRIGPCSDISNPIVVGDTVYVGCFAAEGYTYQRNTTIGNLHIHAFETANWTSRYVGETAITDDGNALLVSAERFAPGGMVLGSGGISAEGSPFLKVSYGFDGWNWTRPEDYGAQFTGAADFPTSTLIDARLNAINYVAHSGTVHLIYTEKYRDGGDVDQADQFHKLYGVAYAQGRFLGTWDLGYGDPEARANFPLHVQGASSAVFDDQHDSIVLHATGRGQERIFVAFGDHGFVRFAEVRESAAPPPVFPLAGPPAPIAAPIPTANPAVVGAAAGILATAVLARMIQSRNKSTAEAPTQ